MCVNSKVTVYDIDSKDKIKLPCKSWYCSSCAPKKTAQLKKNISNEISNWQSVRMMTITLSSKDIDKKEHYRILQEIWRQFLTEIRRQNRFSKRQRNFKYIRVNELTTKEYTHLHILISEYLPQKELYKIVNRIAYNVIDDGIGEARNQYCSVNLEYISSSRQGARYVAKYITKSTTVEIVDYNTGEVICHPDGEEKREKKDRPYKKFWSKSREIEFEKVIKKDGAWIIAIEKKNGISLNLSFLAHLRTSGEENRACKEEIQELMNNIYKEHQKWKDFA